MPRFGGGQDNDKIETKFDSREPVEAIAWASFPGIYRRSKPVKIALNVWPFWEVRITSLNVRVWAIAPCPTASGQTHFRTFRCPFSLSNFGRSFILREGAAPPFETGARMADRNQWPVDMDTFSGEHLLLTLEYSPHVRYPSKQAAT